MQAFHYAFKVKDIESTKKFYGDILGCKLGRETKNWVDFDFFGHQLSAHVSFNLPDLDYCGIVDGINVPIPHYGCILDYKNFELIVNRFKKSQVQFVINPQIRYEGEIAEQKTMFVLDFSNNPIEFKCFKNPEAIFI
jgi:extradiol dioxygenase family protein